MISEIAIQNFFKEDWVEYKKQIKEYEEQVENVSYNIVSISIYSGHLENYHSDIWRFLLDKSAAHKCGNQFLNIFIEYLIANKVINPEYENTLKKAKVHREKGRIDVLLSNEDDKVCLIIENKINNAVDQHNQLERYRDTVKNEGFNIAGILYVTIDGNKLSTIENDDTIVSPIAVYNNEKEKQKFCLLNGWILPSIQNLPNTSEKAIENIKSFLVQYSNLILHLSKTELSNMTTAILYNYLNSKENFETAALIETEFEKIKLVREKKFTEKLVSYFGKNDFFKPAFSKKSHYSDCPNHLIFENFQQLNKRFQLDIVHYKNRTKFVFYNTNNTCNTKETSDLLEEITGKHSFVVSNTKLENQVSFTMIFDNSYKSLIDFDKDVASFGITLFKNFNEFKTAG